MSHKKRDYDVVNDYDPNTRFSVTALSVNEVTFAALDELGWYIAEPEEDG